LAFTGAGGFYVASKKVLKSRRDRKFNLHGGSLFYFMPFWRN